jgi:3-hydroxyacyl-[acyl-carrier-protein] dehydratase
MKDLYKIVSSSGDGIFEVRLNPDHTIFRGHFPDNPVLPGICSLMIVRECASLVAGRQLEYDSVRESKYLSVITPDTELTIKIKLTEADGICLTDAMICSGETTMLKLKARLRPDV